MQHRLGLPSPHRLPQCRPGFLFAQFLFHGVKLSNLAHKPCRQLRLGHVPMDREVLRQWLKAGFVEKGQLFPTGAGTPQGGVISPLLANWTLDGLGATVKGLFGRRPKLHVIRYADDFVVVAETKETLEQTVKPVVQKFLPERGLLLSEEKTVITQSSA